MLRNSLSVTQIPVNSVELTVSDTGSGEAILFVHGSMGDYRSWAYVQRSLSEQFRCISYSRRYNYPNPSQENVSQYSLLDDADDLIFLVEALGLQEVNLVGGSSGGVVSLIAATKRPKMFKSLILIEPALRSWLEFIPGGDKAFQLFLKNAWEPAKIKMDSGDVKGAIATLVDAFNGRGAWEKLPPAGRASMLQNALEIQLALRSPANLTPFTIEQAREIHQDCLIITGDKSPQSYKIIGEELLAQLPQARMLTIENARHAVWVDQPAKFVNVVRGFLADR